MRRLLFTTFSILFVSSHLSHAQSCKLDVITLTAKVEASPESVLYALGDAIALSPGCIADLLEAAIVASKPDDDTLTQIIQLVVSEYPAKVGEIAEAAVLASPESVDVIRKAFEPVKKPIVATPVFETPENPSPIENFLSSYGPTSALADAGAAVPVPTEISLPESTVEVQTSKPSDENDVAETAMKAIDGMLVKLKAQGRDGCVLDGAGDIRSVDSNANGVETFRLNVPDEMVGITTINDPDHHDMKDEELVEPAIEPLVIQDPAPDPKLGIDIEEKLKARGRHAAEAKPASPAMEFTSSVYHIPSSNDLGNPGASGISNPVIRSVSISPTLPRAR